MTAQHTPGPWEYRRAPRPTDGEYDYAIVGEGQIIAEVFGRASAEVRPPAAANAALVALAPEMLAALKAVLDAARWHVEFEGRFNAEAAVINARSLLAEIEGGKT